MEQNVKGKQEEKGNILKERAAVRENLVALLSKISNHLLKCIS